MGTNISKSMQTNKGIQAGEQEQTETILIMDLFITIMQLFPLQVNWWNGIMWIILMFVSPVWTNAEDQSVLMKKYFSGLIITH